MKRALTLIVIALVATSCIDNSITNFFKRRADVSNSEESLSGEPNSNYDPVTDSYYEQRTDDGDYPITRVRKLVFADIANLSKSQLRIMRNEIYARHGYIFSSPDLTSYFGSKPWYIPTSKTVNLNSIESYNVNFIKQYE